MKRLAAPKPKVLEPDRIFRPGELLALPPLPEHGFGDTRLMPNAEVVNIPVCKHRNKTFKTRWVCSDCGKDISVVYP